MSQALQALTQPHLDATKDCPPIDPNKVMLFNMKFCPYGQRAVLTLLAKNIPFDVTNVNLKSKPAWFLDRNPAGKVPTIQYSSDIIYESLIVAEYLDEKFPGPKLMAEDPAQKARDKMFLQRFDGLTSSFWGVYAGITDNEANITRALAEFFLPLEDELSLRGTNFFGGNERPGFVDLMIWPWFERIRIVNLPGSPVNMTKEKFPKLLAYMDRMLDVPSVKAFVISPEKTLEYYLARQTDKNVPPVYFDLRVR